MKTAKGSAMRVSICVVKYLEESVDNYFELSCFGIQEKVATPQCPRMFFSHAGIIQMTGTKCSRNVCLALCTP